MVRRLGGQVDPLRLHSALMADSGRVPPFFINRTGGPALIVESAALSAICKGPEVAIEALTESGKVALTHLADVLAPHLTAQSDQRLTARFERCTVPEEYERAHARSPFDVLRALAFGYVTIDRDEPFALTAAGIIGFDHVDLFEELPPAPVGDFPDFIFWLAESAILVEPSGAARLVCTAFGSDDAATAHRQQSLAQERLTHLTSRLTRALERALVELPAANEAPLQAGRADEGQCRGGRHLPGGPEPRLSRAVRRSRCLVRSVGGGGPEPLYIFRRKWLRHAVRSLARDVRRGPALGRESDRHGLADRRYAAAWADDRRRRPDGG